MKIKASFQTKAFINERGYYAIQQFYGFDESVVIELTPDQMRLLIADMEESLEETEWFNPVED